MSNQEKTTNTGAISIFGKTKPAMQEIGIDLQAIVDTYAFFMEQQAKDPNFRIPNFRARIPAGGGKAFDIITGDDDLDTSVPTFQGVISFCHATNALFDRSDDRMDKPPICQSSDGINGIDEDGVVKKCEDCPQNQWGSDSKGGEGKECKNMRRLYILADGCNIPLVMTLPPTSIRNWEDYRSTIAINRNVPSDVVTEFSLTSETSAQGKPYSIVKFKAVGALSNENRLAVKELSPEQDLTIANDDYYIGPQPDIPPGEANGEVIGETKVEEPQAGNTPPVTKPNF